MEQFGLEVYTTVQTLKPYAIQLTNAFDAEDLMQATIERALKKQHLYKKGNLRSRLQTIMRNIHINHYRKKRVNVQLVGNENLYFFDNSSAKNEFSRSECGKIINNAIDNLRPDYRRVIVLRIIQQKSYQECADILGIPMGTFKPKLHKAKELLKREFESMGLQYIDLLEEARR